MQDHHIQDDSYLTYGLVVHQAQLQQPTGYTSSHSFAETQELMGATKTPPINAQFFVAPINSCATLKCDAATNFNTLPNQVETVYTKVSKECSIHTENGSSLENLSIAYIARRRVTFNLDPPKIGST